VASRLVARIKKAWEKGDNFKVYVVVPLHPEGSPAVDTTQAVMYWQYRTINRDGALSKCMFTQLKQMCPNIRIDDYISFYSLMTHGKISGKYCSTQIYVHSKILIVDDEIMIVGSQNINDRSLLGSRDSELAIKIFDGTEKVEAMFSNRPALVDKFVQDFRLALWKEHLQIDITKEDDDTKRLLKTMKDPTYYGCYIKLWLERAGKNTKIYDEVFPSKPQDSMVNLRDYNPLAEPVNTEKLEDVKGHIILFPLQLFANVSLRHSVVPDIMFQ